MSDDRLSHYHDQWMSQEASQGFPLAQQEIRLQARRMGNNARLQEQIRQYDRVMATVMAQSEVEFKTALQKETNKASPYLDFDNY